MYKKGTTNPKGIERKKRDIEEGGEWLVQRFQFSSIQFRKGYALEAGMHASEGY